MAAKSNNHKQRPLIVGIAGGSGSGKTYLSRVIRERLGEENVALLSMDQYFRSEMSAEISPGSVNFDHPSHLDFHRLISHVLQLRNGRSILAPTYDFASMTQTPKAVRVHARPIVVVEGLFILAEPVVSLCDVTCFLDVATDERLLGRILRDIRERSTEIENVIDRYQRFVRSSYQIFVEPTKQNADIIVDFTYHRALFTESLMRLLASYLSDHVTIDAFVRSLRSESYHTGLHPEDGYMSLTTDIFQLARAYPEKAQLRDIEHPLTSPAAASMGRRNHHRKAQT